MHVSYTMHKQKWSTGSRSCCSRRLVLRGEGLSLLDRQGRQNNKEIFDKNFL